MTLAVAQNKAKEIVETLTPVCERIAICGSIRRKAKEVTDIDLVVIPHRDKIKDMFGTVTALVPIPEFIAIVSKWPKIKGEPTGKYTQRLHEGIKLEISICSPDNWGNITLIRTGNADFSHMVMKRVLKCGFEQKDGFLYDNDKIIALPEEKDYFDILGLPYINPENRDKDAFRAIMRP